MSAITIVLCRLTGCPDLAVPRGAPRLRKNEAARPVVPLDALPIGPP